MAETSVLEELGRIDDDLAKLAADFDAGLLSGKQAQRVVCAAADIERSALVLKTLAMRRVDETAAWRSDGARSPAKWLADKTGTSISDAHGTVELGEQLEQLPQVADAARRGQLSPLKTKIVANAASQDPASEEELLKTARQGSMNTLRKECAAAVQRGADPDAMAKIHARRCYRDWTDRDGAYRFEGTLVPNRAAGFKKTMEAFTDQVFRDARKAGIRDTHEQYQADALVRMAQAALTNSSAANSTAANSTAANGSAARSAGEAPETVPKYTRSRIHVVIVVDGAAWTRGSTMPGETCEIAGLGPIDVATAKRMAGDAIVDIVVTHGIDVRTLAHAKHDLTKAQYAALLAEGYECNVDGCDNNRFLEIDHLGDGWAVTRKTVTGEYAFKCTHHHDLKSHKRWTDGPRLPNGKRKLIPPRNPPPDDG